MELLKEEQESKCKIRRCGFGCKYWVNHLDNRCNYRQINDNSSVPLAVIKRRQLCEYDLKES